MRSRSYFLLSTLETVFRETLATLIFVSKKDNGIYSTDEISKLLLQLKGMDFLSNDLSSKSFGFERFIKFDEFYSEFSGFPKSRLSDWKRLKYLPSLEKLFIYTHLFTNLCSTYIKSLQDIHKHEEYGDVFFSRLDNSFKKIPLADDIGSFKERINYLCSAVNIERDLVNAYKFDHLEMIGVKVCFANKDMLSKNSVFCLEHEYEDMIKSFSSQMERFKSIEDFIFEVNKIKQGGGDYITPGGNFYKQMPSSQYSNFFSFNAILSEACKELVKR